MLLIRPIQITGWLSLVSLVFSLPANAVLWSVQPTVAGNLLYDDNRFLTVDDKESAWSASIDPTVNFSATEPDKGLSGSAAMRFRRYLTDSSNTRSNTDSKDVSLNFGANSYLNTELSTFGFNASLTRSKTNDSQLASNGAVNADSINQDATRIVTNFGPSWSRPLNELTTISLNYNHGSLRYTDELPNSTLVESDTDVVTASLSRGITENIAGLVNVSYSNFRPSTNLDSTTISLLAGVSGNYNETLSGTFTVGRRMTTFDTRAQAPTGFCVGANPGSRFPDCTGGFPVATGTRNINDEENNNGLTFNVSLNKQLESGNLGLTATRIVTPITTTSNNSDSGVLTTTLISVSGSHRFSDRLSSRLSVDISNREDITSNSGSANNRKFINYNAGISWQWLPGLQLSTTYIHQQNQTADVSGTARGNSINFTLNYRLRGLNTSH